MKNRFDSTAMRILLVVIVLMLFAGSDQVFAQEDVTIETVTGLTNENRVISGPYELHITTGEITSALENSTVDLSHEDAWLYFDNLRPYEVDSLLLSSIYVNGNPAVDSTNVRLSVYLQGTVVIPHPVTYHPITIYAGSNFEGAFQKYAIDIYNTSLGQLNDNVRSFKLKRGYMATLAENADGTGYSRCFIAADADLEIPEMPEPLTENVSFIRVLSWEYVSKKGFCGSDPEDYIPLQATWRYGWNAGGETDNYVEYVPMRATKYWPGFETIQGKTNVSHVLGHNEPDHTDQADISVSRMIEQWPELLKTGLRIGSPAWATPNAIAYDGNLYDFLDICDSLHYRVDFVAVHCYWANKSPSRWYADLKTIHEATGRPLWLTEWNNGAGWTSETWPDNTRPLQYTNDNAIKQYEDIVGILEVLDTAAFVERYAIYNWVEEARMMILDNGELTLAGEYYANNNNPGLAFNPDYEVIPSYQIDVTGVSIDPSTTTVLSAETIQLNATVTPENASHPSVTWSSSNPSIASVNEKGLVTGLAEGTATITATTNDGGFEDECVVSVLKGPPDASGIYQAEDAVAGDGVVFSNARSGYSGTGYTDYPPSGGYVEWVLNSQYAGHASFSFRYSNGSSENRPLEAKVNGVVVNSNLSFPVTGGWTKWSKTAVETASFHAGANIIRISAVGNPGANIDYMDISLPEVVNVTGIHLNQSEATLEPAQTLQLTATVNPANASDSSVTWSSDNNGVASVDTSGLVTAVAEGTARIRVTTNDGNFTDTCIVSVTGGTDIGFHRVQSFNVFPNPTNNILNISVEGEHDHTFACIIDLSGRVLINQKLAEKISTLDLSSLDQGVYMLGLKENNNTIFGQKIVKIR